MFDKFKKKLEVKKNVEQLQHEFDKGKADYINVANLPAFTFFVEYFKAKSELNRDDMELINPYNLIERHKLLKLQTQNEIMKQFIEDIEILKQEING